MAAHKGVRLITATIDSVATTGKLVGATVIKGASVEVDKIAAYGDSHYTSVPRSVASWSQFTFTILDEDGTNAWKSKVGKVVAVTVQGSYGDGKGSDTAASAISCDMAILSAEPGGEMTVDGEQKSTIVVTAVPHAPEAAPAQGGNT